MKGHHLRLDVLPRDGIGSVRDPHDHADDDSGTDTVCSGGDKPSDLLLPVIPPSA